MLLFKTNFFHYDWYRKKQTQIYSFSERSHELFNYPKLLNNPWGDRKVAVSN